jgi:hypothetical protein
MNEPRQTALEWMREEFQDARRRHLLKTSVKTGERSTPGPPAGTKPADAAAVIDVVVTAASTDRSTPP